MDEFIVRPDPADARLTQRVRGLDQDGHEIETAVVVERPLTLFLNGQEIVTMMTIGDYPAYLAVGYLINQNMLRPDDDITAVEYDAAIDTVVVRTRAKTDFEEKLKKKTLTSGCAQGTVFGDLMETFEDITLPADAVLKTSWLYKLSRKINTVPSLYLEAGAIHGCVLCEEDRPLIYMEDVGRHNAIDKIAGYMFLNKIAPAGKLFYTTGRLTSEMVIKTVQMRIPILISRSGFTAWGVELARKAGLTLIGRAKGSRLSCCLAPSGLSTTPTPVPSPMRTANTGANQAAKTMPPDGVAGVILAGGLSRRMGGGDKCLRALGGKPILAHIIERVRPQVETLILNANGDPARFDAFGLPVVADVISGQVGPLAGVLTGMEWVQQHAPNCRWLASFASDAPFVPRDLVARLLAAAESAKTELACASSGGQEHHVFGLWRIDLADDLRRAIVEEEIYKVTRWTNRRKRVVVDFQAEPFDPFFNTNWPENLIEAERQLK